MTQTIEQLRAHIAELEEEIGLIELQEQLAAAQEENGRLENQVLARDAELWGRTQEILGLKEQLAKAEQRVAEAFIEYMVDLKQQDFAFTGSTVIGIEKCETAIRSGEYRKFMKGE